MGFLVDPDSAVVWRGPMVMSAIQKLLRQVVWGRLDYLIIDMPPGTGDTQLTISQQIPISGAVIVTTPQKIAIIDAKKGVVMFQKVDVKILGIVQNMAFHECSNCSTRNYLFSNDGARKLANDIGVEVLGDVPLDERIMTCADNGSPFVVQHSDALAAKLYLEVARKVIERLPPPFPL